MPPRTRSALRNAAAPIKSPTYKPKPITKSNQPGKDENADPHTSRVFRDITDQYVAPLSPVATPSVITKPKTHKNIKALIRTAPELVESSLPPSSPPSTSSHIPNSYYPEIQPLSSDPIAPDEDADDPFGFFALEKKLKARRAPTIPKTFRQDGAMISSDPPDVSLLQAFATPKPTNPLVTPRKRAHAKKRRLSSSHSASSANGGDSDGSNMPSTPSPVKVTSLSVDPESVGGEEATETKEVKGNGREAVKRGRKKAKLDEAAMDPKELAKNLEALLPRRPKKRGAAKGRRSAKVAKVEEETKQQKGNNGKGKVRGKRVEDAEGSDGDEEEEEKRVRERQARVDYFKKLDGYEVQKEDVYVV
jgi:hypothetical protein